MSSGVEPCWKVQSRVSSVTPVCPTRRLSPASRMGGAFARIGIGTDASIQSPAPILSSQFSLDAVLNICALSSSIGRLEQPKTEVTSPPETNRALNWTRERERNMEQSSGRRPDISLACSSKASEPPGTCAGMALVPWNCDSGGRGEIRKAASLQFSTYLPLYRVVPMGLEKTRRDER